MARDPLQTLDKLAVALDKRVGKILWDNLTRLRYYLWFTKALGNRTKTRFPYVRKPLQLQGNILECALMAPPPWAGVHIGPAGSSTTISAKGGFLAIPTDFVRQFRGTAVGPRQYGGTVIFGGIIWGKAGWGGARTGGGLRQRRAAGEKLRKQALIPLFILKGSVVIKKRIDPGQLIAWLKPQFLADLKKSCLIDRL